MSDSHDEHDASWLTDQIKAAVADAGQRLADAGPVEQAQPGRDGAIGQLRELLVRQLDAGLEGQCGHLPPRVAQPVHWLPAIPNLWHCDACAQRLIDEWLKVDYHKCDLCWRRLSDEPHSVLVETTVGHALIHAVTCSGCAPGDHGPCPHCGPA